MRRLDGIADAMNMNLGKLWEMVKDREALHVQSMGLQRVRHDWVIDQQQMKVTRDKLGKIFSIFKDTQEFPNSMKTS